MRVEHRICSTICGTLVQAIWDHENLTELTGGGQGRSKSAPEWPESGFGAVQRPLNGSVTPEMDPKWSPQLPLIDLSPFPDLLKHYSHYILKKYQISYIVKIIDF